MCLSNDEREVDVDSLMPYTCHSLLTGTRYKIILYYGMILLLMLHIDVSIFHKEKLLDLFRSSITVRLIKL